MSSSPPISRASSELRVGFVGLGQIGRPIATRLVARGFALSAYDIDRSAVDAFCGETGAPPAATLAALAAASDVIVLSLPTSAAVRTVVLGSDSGGEGLLSATRPGSLVIDMGSSRPTETQELAGELKTRDINMLDAPVSGGVSGAIEGTLTVMVGGPPNLIESVRPLLDAVGSRVFLTGPVGSAHALKALNNLLSAAGMLVTSEALLIGRRFGLDPHVMLQVVNSSSGRNYATEAKFEQFVLPRSFDSGFSLELMLKDLMTAVELAEATGTPAPYSIACCDLWAIARSQLHEGADHTEIARWLETITDGAFVDTD